MSSEVVLRPATIQDAALLLAWRNDPLTRQQSVQNHQISEKEHLNWLQQTLKNPHRLLFIAEQNQQAVGTVRADLMHADTVWQISWTVAPEARGRGLGKKLVHQLIDLLDKPVEALIKQDNYASQRIASAAGLVQVSQDGDLLRYCSQ